MSDYMYIMSLCKVYHIINCFSCVVLLIYVSMNLTKRIRLDFKQISRFFSLVFSKNSLESMAKLFVLGTDFRV